MGYAVAEAAAEAGHTVTLVSGRVHLAPPPTVNVVPVVTSEEMYTAVMENIAHQEVLVMCAAVADYRPADYSTEKIKKQEGRISLELVRTPDILASLPRERKVFVV